MHPALWNTVLPDSAMDTDGLILSLDSISLEHQVVSETPETLVGSMRLGRIWAQAQIDKPTCC